MNGCAAWSSCLDCVTKSKGVCAFCDGSCRASCAGSHSVLQAQDCEATSGSLGLIIVVILVSLLIAMMICFNQVKSFVLSSQRVRRYFDEDGRLVLHEHPEALVEMEEGQDLEEEELVSRVFFRRA